MFTWKLPRKQKKAFALISALLSTLNGEEWLMTNFECEYRTGREKDTSPFWVVEFRRDVVLLPASEVLGTTPFRAYRALCAASKFDSLN